MDNILMLMRAVKKVKVQQSLLQAWTGPDGSRRLRPPDFLTIGSRRC